MWNCCMSGGSAGLAMGLVIPCLMLLLQGCSSMRSTCKLIEIRLAAEQMGENPSSPPALLKAMLFPNPRSWGKGFSPKWLSWPHLPCPSQAAFPPSCAALFLSPCLLPSCHCAVREMWAGCLCWFSHSPPPLSHRWWMGCKTGTAEHKYAGEIAACVTTWRWCPKVPRCSSRVCAPGQALPQPRKDRAHSNNLHVKGVEKETQMVALL